MALRAVYFDLDGTLLDDDQRVPAALFPAIARAQQRGWKVGIATGRRATTTLPYAEAIGVDAPCVLFNGARVTTADLVTPLFHTTLPRVSSLKVIRRVLQMEMYVGAYVDERLLIDPRMPEPRSVMASAALSARETVDLLQLEKAPVKLLFIDEPERLAELRAALTNERLIPPGAHLVRSNPRFLELLPDGVNKATGLWRCAAHLGIDASEILCFGDDENDREMLEVCGLGIAMSHGPPSVHEAADRVIAREDIAAVLDELTSQSHQATTTASPPST